MNAAGDGVDPVVVAGVPVPAEINGNGLNGGTTGNNLVEQSKQCQFCGEDLSPGGGDGVIRLESCQHVYCRSCLETYASSAVAAAPEKINCLVDGCRGTISKTEMEMLLPKAAFEEYLKNLEKTLQQIATISLQCKNKACNHVMKIEVGAGSAHFCPICLAPNSINNNEVKRENGVGIDCSVNGNCRETLEVGGVKNGGLGKPEVAASVITEMDIEEIWEEVGAKMQDEGVNRNVELCTCQYCHYKFEQMEEAIMLQTCCHIFCRKCLVFIIKNQVEAQVPCPISGRKKCGGYLTEAEVKALVEPSVYDEYLKRSLTQVKDGMTNIFLCKTPNCDGWCEFEIGRKTFLCPVCDKLNCLSCKSVHEGISCDVALRIQTLVETGDLRKVEELKEKESTNGWMQIAMALEASKMAGENPENLLGQLLETGIIRNIVKFECAICFSDVEVGQGIILQDCMHLFCRDCLIGHVDNCDDPVVKCPFIDENFSCTSYIQEREIKAFVSPEIYEKYLTRSIKQGESSCTSSFHCKTADCPGWCETDENSVGFDCESCGKRSCIRCDVQHENESCEDYKNRKVQNENEKLSEAALEELIKKGTYMRCPKCKIPVQKAVGCDWLLCPACKTEICWVTRGPRWGPKGRGDITGGCRCRVDKGKPCHPKCGNCH